MSPADGVIDVIECDLGPAVRAFFTTRAGGLSAAPYASLNLGLGVADDERAVRANRLRVAELLGAPVAFATQVHGPDVAEVDAGADVRAGSVAVADALVTRRTDIGLGVLVADCVPVLIAATGPDGAPVLATAHAGRAGLLAGVVGATVAAVRSRGGGDLRAVVGPAICGRCYEVPESMRDEVAEAYPAARATTSWGTPSLDLPGAVVTGLTADGVDVVRVDVCTREDAAMFSHRRDGVTGRSAGVIATRRRVVHSRDGGLG
ncbi:protein of unknown function DUF152 [Beutenbergia cavernae DSM 12333]|uniref:Purine nucleoside phosphorylase n=1 Tax=Beutenbergia cavernae (strain ATCC BAA-8 / DSM 12333 / CCUG 43141 / JCM 11478 / NBRC 16432 / NCIMB 13614 / HKI 0122) TaxID=471853 RepID=C5BW55_BEUC1|nr:polyphenol oxidase family protein [Beutenbergia cavernae]ACQ80656.1 protein of unknown function DUF152 [Beutenbergia cavernae DSM 12333]